jgi:hypothetical protein
MQEYAIAAQLSAIIHRLVGSIVHVVPRFAKVKHSYMQLAQLGPRESSLPADSTLRENFPYGQQPKNSASTRMAAGTPRQVALVAKGSVVSGELSTTSESPFGKARAKGKRRKSILEEIF